MVPTGGSLFLIAGRSSHRDSEQGNQSKSRSETRPPTASLSVPFSFQGAQILSGICALVVVLLLLALAKAGCVAVSAILGSFALSRKQLRLAKNGSLRLHVGWLNLWVSFEESF